eukprot:731367-Pleurochrysis_carterae.AAC.1
MSRLCAPRLCCPVRLAMLRASTPAPNCDKGKQTGSGRVGRSILCRQEAGGQAGRSSATVRPTGGVRGEGTES